MPDGQSWPKISIVTPSYNQGEFIEETIRSVLLQGYPNFEYIIIDGGSTDQTVQVIEKYEPYVSYWVSEPDCGQAAAINKGFAKATGDIFGYINSDDVYNQSTLQTVVGHFTSAQDPKTFWSVYPVEDFGNCDPVTHIPPTDLRLMWWVTGRANLHQPGVFWSRELFRIANGFDISYQYAFDRKFFMQLISKGFTPECHSGFAAAKFRHHKSSKTVTEARKSNSDSGFIAEMTRLSLEFEILLSESEAILLAKLRGQWKLATVHKRFCDREIKKTEALRSYFRIAIKTPKILITRYFWGTASNIIFGNRRNSIGKN